MNKGLKIWLMIGGGKREAGRPKPEAGNKKQEDRSTKMTN